MPLYAFEVLEQSGSITDGKMEAENQAAVAGRLRNMGYTIVDIYELKQSFLQKAVQRKAKVKLADLAIFARQLAAMLVAGIPLTRSLYALSKQQRSPALGEILHDIARNVESGMAFSEMLGTYPDVFSKIFVDMIKAGEVGGALDEMLERLADQLERDKRLRDSMRAATLYPSVILVFAGFIIVAMLLFVVPIFKSFFPPGVELPLPTVIVMAVSDTMREYWYLYILFPLLIILGLRLFMAGGAGAQLWDRVKFRLPLLGDLFRKDTLARFSRTFATLLGGGIPVLQALEVSGSSAGSLQVAETIKLTGIEVQEGQSISVPLQRSGFFPPMMINMVAVGEETGQLPSMLDRVADFFEGEVATMSKSLTSIMEPLLIIFTGIAIGCIVISIYLPIFTSITSVGGM